MPDEITCTRCQRTSVPLESVPYPGELGDELRERVCPRCWDEWIQMEVMVINELRLDFMDPRSQDRLIAELRRFLCLDGIPDDGPPSGEAPTDGPLFEGVPYNGPGRSDGSE